MRSLSAQTISSRGQTNKWPENGNAYIPDCPPPNQFKSNIVNCKDFQTLYDIKPSNTKHTGIRYAYNCATKQSKPCAGGSCKVSTSSPITKLEGNKDVFVPISNIAYLDGTNAASVVKHQGDDMIFSKGSTMHFFLFVTQPMCFIRKASVRVLLEPIKLMVLEYLHWKMVLNQLQDLVVLYNVWLTQLTSSSSLLGSQQINPTKKETQQNNAQQRNKHHPIKTKQTKKK